MPLHHLNGRLVPVRGAPEDHGRHRLCGRAHTFTRREVPLLPQAERQPLRHLPGDERLGHDKRLTTHQTQPYDSRSYCGRGVHGRRPHPSPKSRAGIRLTSTV